MASVGGREYSGTMSKGGVNKCGPCKETGLVKEADAFCMQCDAYMCTDCAASHKSFKMLRNHTVVSGSDLSLFGGREVRRPLTYCEEHSGKDIRWFCEKHDAILCDTCTVISHRKCQVTSISDAAVGHGQSLAEVVGSMTELRERIGNLKNGREKSVEDLTKLQKSFEAEVNQFKTDIVELVERLAMEMVADMNKVVTVEKDVILDHVKAYDSLLPKVETVLRTADAAKAAADGVTNVIAAHKMSKTLKSLEPTVSYIEQDIYTVNVTFQPLNALADVLTGVDRLGTVDIDRAKPDGVDPPGSVSGTVHPASTRRSFTDMEVESSTDITVPNGSITGSAVLPDGRIILAGHGQQQIIILDINFTVQTTLKLQGPPWDVAADGKNGAIMSIYNSRRLQWIHVDGTLRTGSTINTNLPCWGVAVHGGHIYVTVKSSFSGSDYVQVLDRRGTVTRCIGLDASGTGTFMDPCYLTVGARGHVFVTDFIIKGRIACFTDGGDLVYSVQYKDMQNPCGLAVDGDDNVIVCCSSSDDVHVLRKDGSRHRVVLSSADGVTVPWSVTYRHSDNTLIVTMQGTPYCRAYKLK